MSGGDSEADSIEEGAMNDSQGSSNQRVMFVMERHLGHLTYAENLHVALSDVEGVDTTWVWVDYDETHRLWERLPLGAIRGSLRGRFEVGQGFRSARPDVSVCNTQVPMVLGPRSARRAPYVVCTDVTPIQYDRMAEGYGHSADRPGPLRALKHRWNCVVLRNAAAHAPWSRWAAQSLVNDYGVDPSTIEVIPPGVDTTVFTPLKTSGALPRILFVGGDFERKGGSRLLEAFTSLDAGSAELDIVTKASLRVPTGVRMHTDLSPNDGELVNLFRSADIFVLPSDDETFGIAAVEAAASGAALIVSATGGLEELVVDGETGFLLRDRSVAQLATHLRRLVDDASLRSQFGGEARRRAVAEFDGARNAERLLQLALRCVTP
jgi:glycosyltransferase involved in cell wall biosynthesis